MDELDEYLALLEWQAASQDLQRFVTETSNDYKWAWFNQRICQILQSFVREVEYGNDPIFVINMPPRAGKSHICAQRFPVWTMLNHSGWEVVLATYAADLSNRMSRVARDQVAKSNFVNKIWPAAKVHRDLSSVGFWGMENGSTFRAVGVGGALNGQGFNIGIVDDSIKGPEQALSPLIRGKINDWYDSVFLTRKLPQSGVINIQTRWHVDDLAAKMLNDAAATGKTVMHINFPAIAEVDDEHRKIGDALHPDRFPIDKLNAIREKMPAQWWSALYQGNPTVAGGNMFKESDLRFYDRDTMPIRFDKKITVGDVRFGKKDSSGSFVVFQVWGMKGDRRYLLDQARGRWGYAETKAKFIEFCAKHNDARPRYIEKKANAEAMEDELAGIVPGIILQDPIGDKVQRANWVLGDVESGLVYVPMEASWIKDFIEEIRTFPLGMNDDQVDCLTMALSVFKEYEGTIAKLRSLTDIRGL
jgi:predicted phage terminase large subunit-like protein